MNAEPSAAPQGIDIQPLFARSWGLFATAPVAYVLGGLAVAVLGAATLGLLAGPLVVGFIRMVDRHTKGETIRAAMVFDGFQLFTNALLTTLLVILGVVLALALVVLPGVIVGFFCSFALYFVALRGQSPTGAISASFDLTKRNVGSVLLVLVAFVALNFLGCLVVIGALVTLPLSLILMTVSFNELAAR